MTPAMTTGMIDRMTNSGLITPIAAIPTPLFVFAFPLHLFFSNLLITHL